MWAALPRVLGGLVCECLKREHVLNVRNVCSSWQVFSARWTRVLNERDLEIAELAVVRHVTVLSPSPRQWELIGLCHGLTSLCLVYWWNHCEYFDKEMQPDCHRASELEVERAVQALQKKQLETLSVGSLDLRHRGILPRLASSVRHLEFTCKYAGPWLTTQEDDLREALTACPLLTTLRIFSLGAEYQPVLPREAGLLTILEVTHWAKADLLRDLQETKLQAVRLTAKATVLWPFLATNMQLKEAALTTTLTPQLGAQIARMPKTTFTLHSKPADVASLRDCCNIATLVLEYPLRFEVVATLAGLERLVLLVEKWVPQFLTPLATLPLLTNVDVAVAEISSADELDLAWARSCPVLTHLLICDFFRVIHSAALEPIESSDDECRSDDALPGMLEPDVFVRAEGRFSVLQLPDTRHAWPSRRGLPDEPLCAILEDYALSHQGN